MAWEKLGSAEVTGESLKDTADLDTDFSSSTGWTEVGTGNVTIDTSNSRLQYNPDYSGDDDAVVYDLGSGNVSDTKWTLRYKINISSSNVPAWYAVPFFSTENIPMDSSTTADQLGIVIGETTGGSAGAYMNIKYGDGVAPYSTSSGGNTSSALSTGTDYYITFKRTSATAATLEVKTGSHNGTHVLGSPISTTSIPSTVQGLRYLFFRDNKGSTHTRYMNSYIYDLEFYNDSAQVTGSATSITTDSFTAKKHLMIQAYAKGGNGIAFQFNGDTGNNYTQRYSSLGAADGTQTSRGDFWCYYNSSDVNKFATVNIINEATKEKLIIAESVSVATTGAGTAPLRTEAVGKWANTSNAITSVTLKQFTTNGLEEGTEVTVYGTD